MINFAHIMPVNFLSLVENYPVHLLLAHLVEENQQYREFYQQLKKKNPLVYYHLDNSAFEMYNRGAEMYPSDKLIEMGKLVDADSIVMTDYPNQPYQKTIQVAQSLIPILKKEGFHTFFCPQSQCQQVDDLIRSFQWAINNDDINFIGVSILACPNALGYISENNDSATEADRIKFWSARHLIFQELDRRGLLGEKTFKRFHCLGMTHGPNEIQLLQQYIPHIFSWDSSSAAWHGIHHIKFDDSVTGLKSGKLTSEVDFNTPFYSSSKQRVLKNMKIIDKMCDL